MPVAKKNGCVISRLTNPARFRREERIRHAAFSQQSVVRCLTTQVAALLVVSGGTFELSGSSERRARRRPADPRASGFVESGAILSGRACSHCLQRSLGSNCYRAPSPPGARETSAIHAGLAHGALDKPVQLGARAFIKIPERAV